MCMYLIFFLYEVNVNKISVFCCISSPLEISGFLRLESPPCPAVDLAGCLILICKIHMLLVYIEIYTYIQKEYSKLSFIAKVFD